RRSSDLDSFRRLAGTRGADKAVLRAPRIVSRAAHRRARHVVLVQVREQRGAAPDAFEARIRNLLRCCEGTDERNRCRKQGHTKCTVLHSLSPRCSVAAALSALTAA